MESIQNNVGYGSLLVFVAIVFAAATSGAVFSPGAWYAGLNKPVWTPPNWLFGPAWLVLYGCIVTAGWLVWKEAGGSWSLPLWFWAGQLIFNFGWSALFFGLRMPLLGLVDLLLMFACIVGFIVTAWTVSRTAAVLFLPYAIWVSFAGALNFAIWWLNDWPAAAQTP